VIHRLFSRKISLKSVHYFNLALSALQSMSGSRIRTLIGIWLKT